MARWAADIAPHHELAEFVVAAQAIAGNRELKQYLANARLAELRQVTDAWKTVKEEKKRKRRKRRKIEVDGTDAEQENKVEGRLAEHPLPQTEQQAESNSNVEEMDSSKAKDVHEMMKDPEVLARIERNRREAIERRKAAANRFSRPASTPLVPTPFVALPSVNDQDVEQNFTNIDSKDVGDIQQDVDMDVLAEMEHEQRTVAQSQLAVRPNEGAVALVVSAASVATVADVEGALLDRKPNVSIDTDDKEIEGPRNSNCLPTSNVELTTDITRSHPNANAQRPGSISQCKKSLQSPTAHGASFNDCERVCDAFKAMNPQASHLQESKNASKVSEEDVDKDILDEFEAGAEEEY